MVGTCNKMDDYCVTRAQKRARAIKLREIRDKAGLIEAGFHLTRFPAVVVSHKEREMVDKMLKLTVGKEPIHLEL